LLTAGSLESEAAVANLKPAKALAVDDDLAVSLAQFDLANMATRAVNFLGDHLRDRLDPANAARFPPPYRCSRWVNDTVVEAAASDARLFSRSLAIS